MALYAPTSRPEPRLVNGQRRKGHGSLNERVATVSKVEHAPTVPLDLTRHPGHLARRLQQVTFQLWTTTVSTETTPPQFVVLNSLLANPDIDQRTLGEHASLDRSTVADVVARLVQRGLVRRVRDPLDGRRNVLRLTPRGEQVHLEVATRAERMNATVVSGLSSDEQTTLISLLSRIVSGEPEEGCVAPAPRRDGQH